MASKNIFSEGYIQLPVLESEPVSRSLFAGFEFGSGVLLLGGDEGSVRGMVLISRSLARTPALEIPGIGNGSRGRAAGRLWSICEESQLSPAAALKVRGADSAAFLASRDFLSHAARAVWSTGHASAELFSAPFAIVYTVRLFYGQSGKMYGVDELKMNSHANISK